MKATVMSILVLVYWRKKKGLFAFDKEIILVSDWGTLPKSNLYYTLLNFAVRMNRTIRFKKKAMITIIWKATIKGEWSDSIFRRSKKTFAIVLLCSKPFAFFATKRLPQNCNDCNKTLALNVQQNACFLCQMLVSFALVLCATARLPLCSKSFALVHCVYKYNLFFNLRIIWSTLGSRILPSKSLLKWKTKATLKER